MNKELIEKIITYNYNEFGAEYGDALVDLKHENEWLHHIIKEVREELKILKELEDFSIVKLQLTNIVFRLDKENEWANTFHIKLR